MPESPVIPPTDAPEREPAQGERYGRFVLLECIGRGGMAEVFRAVAHGVERFSRVFVVKRIQREHAATPELVEMFANEARISALLNHPNIVQVYDFGQLDGSYFISMEYLRGKDLLAVLRQLRAAGRLMPPALAAMIAREVAAGLAYAHQLVAPGGKGLEIIHRDVSPSNVMLLRAGGVKLLDFGIAKASAALHDDGHTTAAGLVKGKLSYLSPEQVRHEAVDARTDIFSLGVVLWECLTGKRLFHDRSDYHTMNNVLSRTVPPPSTQQAGIPSALDAIVLSMLERDRAVRIKSAKAVVEELDQFLISHPVLPRTLPRLLDELFGPDGHQLESVPPALGAQAGDDETPIMTAVMLPSIPSLTAVSAINGGSSRSDALLPVASVITPAPAVAKPKSLATRIWPWAAGTVLVAAAFAAGRLARPPSPGEGARSEATATAPAPNVVSVGHLLPPPPAPQPRQIAAPPAQANGQPIGATSAAPSAAAAKAAAVPAETVSVRVESNPPGANVAGPNGDLGLTPFTLDLPRGSAPLTLAFDKEGFVPAKQIITPNRDRTAIITLRALPGTRATRKAGSGTAPTDPTAAATPSTEMEAAAVAPSESPPSGITPASTATPTLTATPTGQAPVSPEEAAGKTANRATQEPTPASESGPTAPPPPSPGAASGAPAVGAPAAPKSKPETAPPPASVPAPTPAPPPAPAPAPAASEKSPPGPTTAVAP